MKKILTTILLCGLFGFSAAAMAGNSSAPSITLKTKYYSLYYPIRVQLTPVRLGLGAKTQTYWLNFWNGYTEKVHLTFPEEHVRTANVWLWGNHKAATLELGTESLAKGDTLLMTLTRPSKGEFNLDCTKE